MQAENIAIFALPPAQQTALYRFSEAPCTIGEMAAILRRPERPARR